MRRVGILVRTDGNEATFLLDERLDIDELSRYSDNKHIVAELRFDDNRTITADQRKKIFALIGDIAYFTGYTKMESADNLKLEYMLKKDVEYFSFSDCSVSLARDFISFIIELCFKFDIPFRDKGLNLNDDITRYLFLCIKYRKCCICGQPANIHHVDTVGMGRDRRKVDNTENRLIALCHRHHREVHQVGQETFDQKHMVQGIKLNDDAIKRLKIGGIIQYEQERDIR